MAQPSQRDPIPFRFSLYGFLKNQTYYEPFLILALREKGLSFFAIGLLIGFRELCVNLFEVPSGAVASPPSGGADISAGVGSGDVSGKQTGSSGIIRIACSHPPGMSRQMVGS